jgi:hypothetical protein
MNFYYAFIVTLCCLSGLNSFMIQNDLVSLENSLWSFRSFFVFFSRKMKKYFYALVIVNA